jgi:sulfite reductase (NADPH) flavoprotein alpha-component
MIENLPNSPFSPRQLKEINDFIKQLNPDQKLWLGGYLSGLNESTYSILKLLQSSGQQKFESNNSQQNDSSGLLILYGTRSGNSLKVAKNTLAIAESKGLVARLASLNEYDPKSIKKESTVFIVISTDGEGEPPLAAEEFYNYLMSKKITGLKNLKYSVLALGDSTYQHFCKIGRDIDERLLNLGAFQIHKRVDCDSDFEVSSEEWANEAVIAFLKQQPQISVSANTPVREGIKDVTPCRANPFHAQLLERINLNGKGSTKRTWHMEFDIEESNLVFQPGDALGVLCYNNQPLVNEVIALTGYKAESLIKKDGEERLLHEVLTHDFELSNITGQTVEAYAKLTNNNDLLKLCSHKDKLFKYVYGRDIVDLLNDYPAKIDLDSFLSILRKLQPRLYSIASSYNANPEEVHLLVREVEYFANKRKHRGCCSYMLSMFPEDEKVPIYVDENISFRLPEDSATPVIMIGSGTGIAPYRSFLQEIELKSLDNKTWLFFGERNFATDFLYQLEWQKYLKNKTLTRMDIAFSRDQASKIYVQNKLAENSKELYKWIEEGAYIYLCGDKNSLARDVKQTLLEIVAKEGGLNHDKATDYFRILRKEGRFQEDVY